MSGDENLRVDTLTPPQLQEVASAIKCDLLPTKSREIYASTYEAFLRWKLKNKAQSCSERVLTAYFYELGQKYKPSTLWLLYLMLKANLKIKENVNIDNYFDLIAFLKKKSEGFVSKKAVVFSSENIKKFLDEAPDDEHSITKVALIFGISGACRKNELINVECEDIREEGELRVVKIPETKTNKQRTFVISEEFVKIVKEYRDLRPSATDSKHFFLNYAKGKCTRQVIGIHKMATVACQIANFLKLENPKSFTSHSFRRISTTLLADSRANITTLKCHGGWKLSTVAEGYIENYIKNEAKISNLISSSINFDPLQETAKVDESTAKRRKIETSTSTLKDIHYIERANLK